MANPYENLEAIYHMAEVSWVRAYQQRFQSVRFGAQELAAALDSLLFGAIGDTGRIERHVIPLIGTRRVNVHAASSARAFRRITCGGWPKARRKARRMR